MMPYRQNHRHKGKRVSIGPYKVWAGGYRLSDSCLESTDLLVALGGELPVSFGEVCPLPVLWMPLPDFGGVPYNWEKVLREAVISEMEGGKSLAFFCYLGHGRTGCMLASLIALMESDDQTPDPIRALRRRYCSGAVETIDQARAVFALRDKALPRPYQRLQGTRRR